MAVRTRLLLAALGVAAVVLLPTFGSITTTVGVADDVEAIAGAPAADLVVALQTSRPLPPLTTAVAIVVAVVTALVVCSAALSIDRVHCRLSDAGDDWRSLLRGAPPAQV